MKKNLLYPVSISRLGLGTAHFGQDYGFCRKKTQFEVDAILEVCLENNIKFIDTARGYGDSEAKLGNFFSRHSQSDFVISTKLSGFDPNASHNQQRKALESSIDQSLLDLKIDRIDILNFHQEPSPLINHPEFWAWIDEFKRKGKIALFGISVYEPETTLNLLNQYAGKIDSVQFPYNILDQRFIPLLQMFQNQSIIGISRSVFLKGLLAKDGEDIPSGLGEHFRKIHFTLVEFSKQNYLSLSELALLFAASNPLIKSSIIGFNSPQEVRDATHILNQRSSVSFTAEQLSGFATNDLELIDPRKWPFL